jgi:hypothetical protein
MDFSYYCEKKRHVMDTIMRKPSSMIPIALLHIMQHSVIERIAKVLPGSYEKDPVHVYLKAQKNMNVDIIDQFIPENPLSMGDYGYEGGRSATTGAKEIIVSNIKIESPEDVVAHMEKFIFPGLKKAIQEFDEEQYIRDVIQRETEIQRLFGEDILRTGYGFCPFPYMRYGTYGYVNYFCAYALYPEIIERDFKLQSELAYLKNKAVAKMYKQYKLPPLYRADHDMTDSRGTLVNIKSMEKIWFPYFEKCFRPVIDAGVTVIWHCDGNIMPMVPYLLECGIKGFQGFQYEDGIDYVKLCKMKARDGEELVIQAGVSVTVTLPFGTPEDVKKELKFLVENGPKNGLILGLSSSLVPGVKWENIKTLIEGLNYYRIHGRKG